MDWEAELRSRSQHKRLRAARHLTRNPDRRYRDALLVALQSETVGWVRSALREAIQAIDPDEREAVGVEITIVDEEERVQEERVAAGIEETTTRLIHEIRPILGRLERYAQREIENYENSRTSRQVERLRSLVGAIDRLKTASGAPMLDDFVLDELIDAVIESEGEGSRVHVEAAGVRPLPIVADRGLVEMVIAQGLRNAIEATDPCAAGDGPGVTVTWGSTDKDYWVTILDRGPGTYGITEQLFELGETTKVGHFGVGLTLAKRAALALGGRIRLLPRNTQGLRFEFRWPHGIGRK